MNEPRPDLDDGHVYGENDVIVCVHGRDYDASKCPRLGEEKRRTIAGIRAVMASLGYPLDDLTDEQIEEGVERFGEVVRASMVTVAQATEAFASLGRALASSPGPVSLP